MRLIKHQMQPCPVSCVSTCMAMLSGRPVDEVIAIVHERYRAFGLSLREMMTELGIEFQSFDTCDDNNLGLVGAYLVHVPSLNFVGGNHQILIEITEDDYYVIDPVQGRADRKYYVKRGEATGALEVELHGYSLDAFIDAAWLAAR